MTQEEIIAGNKLIAEFMGWGYEIYQSGKVRGKLGTFLKLYPNKNGYMQVNIYNDSKSKTLLIHRLVASAFIPNPSKLPEVNHKDGNKLNNNVSNLEWCTRSQNIKHGIDTGLIKKSMIGRLGNKHWRSRTVLQTKPNGEQVEYESTGDASRKTGFNRTSIQDACKGKLKTYKLSTWKYKE